MSPNKRARLAGTAAVCLAMTALPTVAAATEGYFALGVGPVQRGAGGAGVAATTDAMGAALNPASVAEVGKEVAIGIELFSPKRGFTGTSTIFVPDDEVRSEKEFFPIPNFAYNVPLGGGGVLNIAAYGNGGLNTSYENVFNGNCGGAGAGVFCAGDAGVDLMQLFVSATYAQKSGPVSWGIAPTLAVQRFEAFGLEAFTGFSMDPAHMTGTGYSLSTGVGLRGGVQVEVSPALTIGLSGQTKFDMSEFDEYAGLFEGGGDFDIPASVTAGVAIQASPALTVMLDYQRIYFGGVPAIANGLVAAPFGADGGPGFGWDDVDVVKFGIEWESKPGTVWRAGYAHASNPITDPTTVMLNILAPGVVEDHYTFGGSRDLGNGATLDFAVNVVASNSATGPEIIPGFGPTGGTIEIDMHQASVSIGWRKAL